MTTPGQPTARRRRWSWVWILLGISLALNLAVVAAVISYQFFGQHRPGHRITGPGYTQVLPRAFFRQLDQTRREELVSGLRVHRREFRGLRADLREKARGIAVALRAEPFDQAALEQAMSSYEQASGTMVARGGELARELFAKLTPAERRLMADEIERKSTSRRKRRMDRDGDSNSASE